MEYSVVIVNRNSIDHSFDNVDITKDLLRSIITPHCQEIMISQDKLMEKVIEVNQLTPEIMGSTDPFYETNTHAYQMCHKNLDEYQNQQTNNENGQDKNSICSWMSSGYDNRYDDILLLSCKIGENGICSFDNIKIEDVVDVLYSKLIHKCIKIGIDGTVTELEFKRSPIETEKSFENCRWVECPFFMYNLLIGINESETEVNKKATRLMGVCKIKGDVLVISKSSENEYIDLDMKLFNKFMKASWGPNKQREVKQEDNKIDGLPVIVNKHNHLDQFLANVKMNCHGCDEPLMDSGKTCTGCFRMKYHNEECIKRDWWRHKEDCLHELKKK